MAQYTFAKLTLAKTIGDTELKNIYMRPVLVDDQVRISLTLSQKRANSG